jgi:hypothetical protein
LRKGKHYYKTSLRKIVWVPKTSTSPQTSAAEVHLAKGQFLLKERTLKKAKYLI